MPMRAFVRGAMWLLLAAAALAVHGAWAAPQAQTCADETKFNTCSEIDGVPTGKNWCGAMKFTDGGIVAGYGRVIYAVGQINMPSSKNDTNILDNTPKAFQDFLTSARIKPGALVVLHSPGGSVLGGLQLGRLFHNNSLRTMVGQPRAANSSTPLTALVTNAPAPGVCASACSMAFLGGTRRTVPNGSLYGVHAAEVTDVPGNVTIGGLYYAGQVTAMQTSTYLTQMGIDPSWLFMADRWCQAGQNQILFLSAAQMTQLKVTTGFTTDWQLADDHGIITLAGYNPDSSAIPGYADDLILACVGKPRQVVMRIDYLPEVYNAGELSGTRRSAPAAFTQLVSGYSLSGFKANTAANDQPALIDVAAAQTLAPLSVVDQHHVTTTIPVTAQIAGLLKGSDILTLSFEQQATPVGEVSFDLSAGTQEIGDYIAACQ